MRNEQYIASLKAPFGKLNTTLPEARALVQVCGKLGLVATIQGNRTGYQEYPTVAEMTEQGVDDTDQIFLELLIAPQTGGIDAAQIIAAFRADWRYGVNRLMTDVYQNPTVAMDRAINAITLIPEVQAAAAAALKF